MRVIVTGSRDWPWGQVVYDDLTELAHDCLSKQEELRLFFGDCPTGPDAVTDKWVENNDELIAGWRCFPADWDDYGKAAGPIRNRRMIAYVQAMDMDDEVICLAYRLEGSRGTTDCMDRAWRAGFEVRTWDLARRVGKKP